MYCSTRKPTAYHECSHAVAMAVVCGCLPDVVYVGCRADGSEGTGITIGGGFNDGLDGAMRGIIYTLSGVAGEIRVDSEADGRKQAFQDDIVVEKLMREVLDTDAGKFYGYDYIVTAAIKQTQDVIERFWACIVDLSEKLLASAPRVLSIEGEECLVYKIEHADIKEVLERHGVTHAKQMPRDPYLDSEFDVMVERQIKAFKLIRENPTIFDKKQLGQRLYEMTRPRNGDYLGLNRKIGNDYWLWLEKNPDRRKIMEITVKCKCGSSQLSIPDNATDDSSVRCEDCGNEDTKWGELKAASEKAVLEHAGEQLRGILKEAFRGDPNITVK